uniref:Platelet endothelial aggregation receptor 1-like n=1 Tax=Crassostrea virginica TaxID=6565 RepID=A0A8B8C6I5_CRAVI|nr:platelet endothelial aggregation receptor 1-like [Crassostrea virginica]
MFGLILMMLSLPGSLSYDQLVQENITEAVSSTTHSHHKASFAVDGDFSQKVEICSHTAIEHGIREAWLRIDLRDIYSIKSVKFWYRDDMIVRLPGYSIRVSNSSVLPPAESSCYTDTGNVTLPNIIENDCERTARYVWFYQASIYRPNPIIEICEVQVFGCETGRHGVNCSSTCEHCRNNASCDIMTGECDDNGCSNNKLEPPFCTDCVVGLFGENCKEHCNRLCKNSNCDKTTGRCISGCEDGYVGSYCNTKCGSGTYGRNCSETCGTCFDGTPCHHIYGHCSLGCSPGWKSTPTCDAPCPPGTFGLNCINKCSGNCLHHATCDKETGKCKACSEGWRNDFCNERAPEPITDLEKITLEHQKIDNQRLLLESEKLRKESEKISIETVFLKIKEKYLQLKMQSEFQIFPSSEPKT